MLTFVGDIIDESFGITEVRFLVVIHRIFVTFCGVLVLCRFLGLRFLRHLRNLSAPSRAVCPRRVVKKMAVDRMSRLSRRDITANLLYAHAHILRLFIGFDSLDATNALKRLKKSHNWSIRCFKIFAASNGLHHYLRK